MQIQKLTNTTQSFGLPWDPKQRDMIPEIISQTCPRNEIIDAFEKFMWLDCDFYTPNHKIYIGSINKKQKGKNKLPNITLIAEPIRNGVTWEYEHLDTTGKKTFKTSLDILAHEIQASNRTYYSDPAYYSSLPPEYAAIKFRERLDADEHFDEMFNKDKE